MQLLACPPGGLPRSELKALLRAGNLVGRAADSDARVPSADMELEGILNELTPWLVSSGRNRCDSLLRLEHATIRRAVQRRYDQLWNPSPSEEDESGCTTSSSLSLTEKEQDRQGYAWVRASIWTVGKEKLQVHSTAQFFFSAWVCFLPLYPVVIAC